MATLSRVTRRSWITRVDVARGQDVFERAEDEKEGQRYGTPRGQRYGMHRILDVQVSMEYNR